MANEPVPAAQYLRMSTEHQQYSLENQATAIAAYAALRAFNVVRTYSDAAKSGVGLKHRMGLRQLLQDVVSGKPEFRVILVYDVSRWGRFQDIDESAHYEFLCKSAGVPVHYCAEQFTNDGSLPSLIMKALKRTMAGEYSRELGIKVLAGQKRLAHLGFKQGGRPGYGLRRLLVTPEREHKQPLAIGERKGIATDRVILVPGPSHEVEVVTEIFRMLVSEKRTVYGIARELNPRCVPYTEESKWDYQAVHNILTHPKYMGCHAFNRTTRKLYTPTVWLPRSEWILTPGAFEPLIDRETFEGAQRILKGRTSNRSNQEILDALRALLTAHGRLSLRLIQLSLGLPCPSTYRHRFGSLRRAYELIGYGRPDQFGPIDLRARIMALRERLLDEIVAAFPSDVHIVRRGGRWRSQLRMRSGLTVSVLVARSIKAWKNTIRWQVDPVQRERNCVTFLARLDETNQAFVDFYVLPRIDRARRFRISLRDSWLHNGLPLKRLADFLAVLDSVRESRRAEICGRY